MAGTRAEFEGHTGVWVTSRGRKIFIRDGESITDSILRYNKSKGIKTTRNDIQSSKYEYDKMNKQQSFINSVPKEIDEKEYNQNAKEFRDAFDLEDEYNKLYENPNYYDEMQGTNRLKAKFENDKIDAYFGRHTSTEDDRKLRHQYTDQKMKENIENKKDVFDFARKLKEEENKDTLENITNEYINRVSDATTNQKLADADKWYKEQLEKNGYENTKNYSDANYFYETSNPMEEFSDTVGDGLSDLQRNAMNKNANEDKLKEIYTMDRVLRGLNDEDGLYESGWLMNGVADEETDFGYDEFKSSSEKINHPGEYYYVDDYDDLKKMYKSIMDEYAESGIVSRRAYEGKDGYKENAGLTDEEIAYAKKDFPNIPVYGKGWAIEKEIKDDSKEVSNVDSEGYKYYTKHGIGPGMLPSDVKLGDIQDYDDGMTSFRTNRPLSSKELNYYSIENETRNSEYDKKYTNSVDDSIGDYTGKSVKELRKAMRNMQPYSEEIRIGNRVISKTSNGYAVRNKDDYDDPMTDYSAYVYGFKEKWIIDEAVKNNELINESLNVKAKVDRFKERKGKTTSSTNKPLEKMTKRELVEKIVDDQIKRGTIPKESRERQIEGRLKGAGAMRPQSKEELLKYFK